MSSIIFLIPKPIINFIDSVNKFIDSDLQSKIKIIAKKTFVVLAAILLCLANSKIFFAAFILGYLLSSSGKEGEKCYVSELLHRIKGFYVKHPIIGGVLTAINIIHSLYAGLFLLSMSLGRELKQSI